MLSRTITGAILVAVLIAAIIISPYSSVIIFTIIGLAGLHEFYGIYSKQGVEPQVIQGLVLGFSLFVCNYILAAGFVKPQLLYIPVVIAMYIAINELFRQKAAPFNNIAITYFGVFYIAMPLSLFPYLGFRDNIDLYNPHLILGFFILMWSYDTFAYLTGRTFGKHRLFERVSPKKSWEGAIGGLVISSAIAWLLSKFFVDLTSWQWVVTAVIIAVFGTFGDLIESMFKRSVDIKDSGSILPGHGGILDRFDAVFIAAPAVFLYLQFI
jgi:phosphatidate cytidylyltransferase